MFSPALLLVFVTGHAVDRYNRKGIIVAAAVVEAACSLVLAGFALAQVRDLLLTLAVVALLGTARAFGNPAERTILVNIVGTEGYVKAQARYSSMREIVVIAGPAAGGALLAISDATAFLVAAALIVLRLPGSRSCAYAPRSGRREPSSTRGRRSTAFGSSPRGRSCSARSRSTCSRSSSAARARCCPSMRCRFCTSARSASDCCAAPAVLGRRRWRSSFRVDPPQRRVGRTLLTAVAGFGVATHRLRVLAQHLAFDCRAGCGRRLRYGERRDP